MRFDDYRLLCVYLPASIHWITINLICEATVGTTIATAHQGSVYPSALPSNDGVSVLHGLDGILIE